MKELIEKKRERYLINKKIQEYDENENDQQKDIIKRKSLIKMN